MRLQPVGVLEDKEDSLLTWGGSVLRMLRHARRDSKTNRGSTHSVQKLSDTMAIYHTEGKVFVEERTLSYVGKLYITKA